LFAAPSLKQLLDAGIPLFDTDEMHRLRSIPETWTFEK